VGIRFPALIDGIDNSVEQLYTGWPDRLMLIDREGRLVYKSEPGPFGFNISVRGCFAAATILKIP